MTVMLACGHAANATDKDGEPSCAICAGIDAGARVVVATPDLDGRTARCSCGATRPSSTGLAFFEYRGEGSRSAVDTCKHCRYALVAHERKRSEPHLRLVCDHFEPHGAWEHDSFYCGCRGFE